MGIINKRLGFCNKFKIIMFDTILANLEINIFIFSFILSVIFVLLGNPIFLSLEMLFIVGIFPSFLNSFKAFTNKFPSLCVCLIFTYFIVYFYNWISIFYLRKAFVFINVYNYELGTHISESFCQSSLQCFLVLINYGTRSGGGISDILPIISYRKGASIFIAKFFL